MERRNGRTILIAGLAAAGLLLSGCASAQTGQFPDTIRMEAAKGENTVTVTASEKVKVVPDRAEIVFGVTTQATDAAACQDQNTAQVNQVIELLKSSGIEESSIRTGDYWMNPRYDWSGDVQKLIGYEMHTGITLSGVPLEQVGDLLSGAVEKGVNTIDSVTYSSSKYDETYQEALKLAAASARAKAEALAAAESAQVLDVLDMQEFSDESSAKYTDYSLNSRAVTEDSAAGAAVMPGEVEVCARITVTYELKQ